MVLFSECLDNFSSDIIHAQQAHLHEETAKYIHSLLYVAAFSLLTTFQMHTMKLWKRQRTSRILSAGDKHNFFPFKDHMKSKHLQRLTFFLPTLSLRLIF